MKSAAIVALLICIFALSAYSTPPTFSHIISSESAVAQGGDLCDIQDSVGFSTLF